MRSVSVRLADLERVTIPIGFEGENNYTHVNIDCKKIFDEDNSFVPTLALVSPEGEKYPGIVTRDGDIVTWVVSASDLTTRGGGELQLAFTKGTTIGKTYVARTRIERSITPTGEVPSVIANFIIEAGAIVNGIPQAIADALNDAMGDITAEAETLQPGSSASASFDLETKVFTIGVPEGDKGDPGTPGSPGKDGEDGVSPVITVTDITGGHRITIVDAEGTHTIDVMNGEDGTPGADGYSPTVAITDITGGHTVTITDKNGAHAFNVMDGNPAELIDDTTPALNKTFSSDKLNTELNGLKSAIERKFGIQNVGDGLNVSEDVSTGSSRITLNADVQQSDITNLQQNKADIIITSASGSIASISDGADDLPIEDMVVQIEPVQSGSGNPSPSNVRPITGWTGAQISRTNGKESTDPDYVGQTYPITWDSAGTVYGGTLNPVTGELVVDHASKDLGSLNYTRTSGSDGVYVFTTAGFSDKKTGVTNIISDLFATTSVTSWGASKPDNSICGSASSTTVVIRADAYTDASSLKTALNGHLAVYELATPIAYTLTPTEIRTLLGANNIWADTGDVAVQYRADTRLYVDRMSASGGITIDTALSSSSTNPVQNKVINTALSGKEPKHNTVSVSGTTPTISGVADTRYICGECSTLTITAPASGCIDVTFVSGSTPTVLTVNSAKSNTTVKWANGFDPSSLDANTTYEVNILDGEWGVVGAWT